MNFQDNFGNLLFGIFTIDVRRPIGDLEPEKQHKSRALGLKEDVWHQKYGQWPYVNQNESLQNYLEF